MSFSIFNFKSSENKYKIYNQTIGLIVSISVCILYSWAVYLEPLSGDLTRIGGYSENFFGWQGKQEHFSKPLYHRDIYDKYYDIVIFGDSFSYKNPGEQTHVGSYWHNYLINDTNLSAIVFDTNRVDISNVIDSATFRKKPPLIFILELAERDLIWEVPAIKGDIIEMQKSLSVEPAVSAKLKITPKYLSTIKYQRSKLYDNGNIDWLFPDLGYAGNYLKKAAVRNIFGLNYTNAMKAELMSDKVLFSNKKNNEILFNAEELNKREWDLQQIGNTKKALLKVQKKIQSNQYPHFIFFIAPDKTTIYSDNIKNKRFKNLSKIDSFISEGFNQIQIYVKLRDAVKKGLIDIYFPNDTHWGSTGHKIASDAILEYLLGKNILLPKIDDITYYNQKNLIKQSG